MIRAGVDLAMRLLGEQFVTGETIDEALVRARRREREGFRYSFDMLGEAALTEDDAQRYLAAYENAIHAIGQASAGRGIHEGPGISIKLSALHPRYVRAQRRRVLDELYPRLRELATLARAHDIGLNIDAEEADRLELSLDLLERLCVRDRARRLARPRLRRAGLPEALRARSSTGPDRPRAAAAAAASWCASSRARTGTARSSARRSTASTDYPVFTRKVHTDVSYLACAAASCWPRPTRSIRSSRPTTRSRSRRSSRWRVPTSAALRVPVPARHGRVAVRPGRRRPTVASAGRAASTRRSARTKRCWRTSCAACSRTAPTRRS